MLDKAHAHAVSHNAGNNNVKIWKASQRVGIFYAGKRVRLDTFYTGEENFKR